MKKLLLYIGIVAGITLMLMLVLNWGYTIIYKNGLPRNKLAYVLSTNKAIDYVFIGSSRVDNFINAEILENKTGKTALNLGIQGSNLDDYYLLLQIAHKQKIIKDTVFIQLDYVYNHGDSSDILKSFMMPYLDNKDIASFVKERTSNYFALKNIPFYKYMKYDFKLGFREVFATLIHKPNKIDLSNGYFPKYGTVQKGGSFHFPKKIIEENTVVTQIEAFSKINNITIIYFVSPICSNSYNLDYIDKLRSKVPQLWDFSTSLFDNDDYFYNCSHTNDKGATRFSEIFAEKLMSN